MLRSTRLALLVSVLGLAAIGTSSASAATTNVSFAAREIGPGDEMVVAKQFVRLTLNASQACEVVSVSRAVEALVAPIPVAISFAVFRADLIGYLNFGATDPCSVAWQSARTATTLYALALRGQYATVVARTDEIGRTGRNLCWARIGIGTSVGSVVPFNVKFLKPLTGCGGSRI